MLIALLQMKKSLKEPPYLSNKARAVVIATQQKIRIRWKPIDDVEEDF
jgi:hypothetical protein